jgi:single-stranded DNA-binding protein
MTINNFNLEGTIGSEIRTEEFQSKSGDGTKKVRATFILANRRRGREGEPEWLRIETWGKQAENLIRFNGKGSKVTVVGHLSGQFYNPDGGSRGGQLRQKLVADSISYNSAPRSAHEAQSEPEAAAPRSTRR